MIKILNKNDWLINRVNCKNCGVILEYSLEDVQKRNLNYYSGSPCTVKYIQCIGCYKEVILSSL